MEKPSEPIPSSYRMPTPVGTRTRSRSAGILNALRRQRRNWFTLDRVREFGTTLALVVPLTLLIWVWAEREQNVPSEKMLFIIDVRSFDPTKTMSIVRDGTTSEAVTVELTGPRSGLDAIREAIAENPSKSRLNVEVTEPLEPSAEPYRISIGSRLNQQEIFESNGVSVQGTEPATAQVLVDRVVERELEVKLRPDLASRVESAEFNPQTVKVSGPERVITQLEAQGKLVAELELSTQSQIMSARPGTEIVLGQERIRPIVGTGVNLVTQQISGGKLKMSQKERGVIRSMAVFIAKPALYEGQYSVTGMPLTLTNVPVTGPMDVLKRLEADEITPKPFALITIVREDQGKTLDRLPTFQQLPPGVEVDMQQVGPLHFSVTGSDASNDDRTVP